MIVARTGYGNSQQILMLIHGTDDRRQKYQKLYILSRILGRIKQILSGIGGHRPVIMLAGTIHAGKGLFMQ